MSNKQKLRSVILVLLILSVLLLCGCSPKITQGEVYKKEYYPARTYTRINWIYINGSLKSFPQVIHKPERYVVFIRVEKNGTEITEDFYVDVKTYHDISVGDWYSASS